MFRQLRRLITTGARDCNSIVLVRAAVESRPGSLHGSSFILKDNFTTTQEPTTCGSRMLETYVSPFDATAVHLLEAAGLELVGKSNMDEFGMGSSTTYSIHGPTVNPRYEEVRISGGSSGGSAAAIAANLADFALGTDTGGSVRQPASYCGIVGFKPTYGRLSRYGVVAYAQGFDTVGILAKNVDTVKKVYGVLNKPDEKDITSLPESIRAKLAKPKSQNMLTIGIPREFLLAELSSETILQFENILVKLTDLGHTVKPVSVPAIGKLLSTYYTLATAEAASNLSRFDGIRYGHLLEVGSGIDRMARNRSAGFGPEVQRRIVLGNYTLSSESADFYLQATHLRKKLVEEFNDVFALRNILTNGETFETERTEEGCDVLMCPTAFGKAPTLAEFESNTENNFLNGYINDILTVPASLAGLPAISVPCENADFGVQVMAQFGDDSTVLELASVIETCT